MSFPGRNDEPGNRHRMAYLSEAGDYTVDGAFGVGGAATFNSNVTVLGDLILSDTSVVDLTASTVYNFADPTLELNKSFTGAYVPTSGLDVNRGAGVDHAFLSFVENVGRTDNAWRVGIGADLLRVARVPDAIGDKSATYWDAGSFAVAGHTGISYFSDRASFSVPVQENIPASGGVTSVRYNEPGRTYVSLDYYEAGVLQDSLLLGDTSAYTFGAHTFGDIFSIGDTRGLLFRASSPSFDDARFIFDEVCALGTVGSDALIQSTKPLHVNGTDHTYIGTVGSLVNQVDVAAGSVTLNAPVAIPANSLDVYSLFVDQLSFKNPSGVSFLPSGWGGSETQNGVTVTSTSNLAAGFTEYEVTVAYAFGVLDPVDEGKSVQMVAPIYIGGDFSRVRGLWGITRRVVGGVTADVRGIPPGDLWIQAPFSIGSLVPPLTDGYHFLTLNVVMVSSTSWQHVVTVRTGLPELT